LILHGISIINAGVAIDKKRSVCGQTPMEFAEIAMWLGKVFIF
jgi:hypothetical protein